MSKAKGLTKKEFRKIVDAMDESGIPSELQIPPAKAENIMELINLAVVNGGAVELVMNGKPYRIIVEEK